LDLVPKDPAISDFAGTGSSRMCRCVPLRAAVCRGLWTRRGRDLGASSQAASEGGAHISAGRPLLDDDHVVPPVPMGTPDTPLRDTGSSLAPGLAMASDAAPGHIPAVDLASADLPNLTRIDTRNSCH
jgi:hypothetical protein